MPPVTQSSDRRIDISTAIYTVVNHDLLRTHITVLELGGVLGLDSRDVVGDHAVPVAFVVVDSVAIVRSLLAGARQRVAVLPEQIASNARRVEGGSLPRVLDGAVVAATVYDQSASR
jgi:hypothetical protein